MKDYKETTRPFISSQLIDWYDLEMEKIKKVSDEKEKKCIDMIQSVLRVQPIDYFATNYQDTEIQQIAEDVIEGVKPSVALKQSHERTNSNVFSLRDQKTVENIARYGFTRDLKRILNELSNLQAEPIQTGLQSKLMDEFSGFAQLQIVRNDWIVDIQDHFEPEFNPRKSILKEQYLSDLRNRIVEYRFV